MLDADNQYSEKRGRTAMPLLLLPPTPKSALEGVSEMTVNAKTYFRSTDDAVMSTSDLRHDLPDNGFGGTPKSGRGTGRRRCHGCL